LQKFPQKKHEIKEFGVLERLHKIKETGFFVKKNNLSEFSPKYLNKLKIKIELEILK